MKRIMFFIISIPHGGAEWVVTNLCNELAKKGINVTLVSVKGGDLIENEIDSKVEVHSFGGSYFKTFWYIYSHLFLRKYDSVFATLRTQSVMLSLLHLFSFSNATLNIREAASNFANSLLNFPRLKKWIYSFSYGRADNIICNSRGTADDLINAGIVKNDKNITIINNPVDLKGIRQKATKDMNCQINFEKFTIVTVSRLVPLKNIDLVIKAIPLIKKKINDVQLIVIGSGKMRASLEELTKRLKIDKDVSFLGYLQNPYPYMSKADIFVLASKWEGFGMVIVESLALGTPVIATDINGGPKQILKNGELGELIPVGSVESLADKIMNYPEKNLNTQKLIKRAFAYDKAAITDVYHEVIFN